MLKSIALMLMMMKMGKRFMDSYANRLILTGCSAVHVGTSCDHREQSIAR